MFSRTALSALLVLSVMGCTPPADPAPEVPALSADNYRMMPLADLGLTGAETLPEAAAAIRARLGSGEPGEGNYSETVAAADMGDGRGRVVLTLDGLPDDAVMTEQHVVTFTLRPDGQVAGRVFAMAEGYGIRQKCGRGATPGVWTNQPCP